MPKTKIVATVGPASQTPEVLSSLIEAGVDVLRVNCSHGTARENGALIREVRAAVAQSPRTVAILADLQGPKMRLGVLADKLTLAQGERVQLRSGAAEQSDQAIPIRHDIVADLDVGDRILLRDGIVEVEVLTIDGDLVEAMVLQGGTIASRQGVNLPGSNLRTRAPTPKDLEDLPVVLDAGVDMLALSFVRSPSDILALRSALPPAHADIPIIAKIERPEAIKDLDEIVAASYGVMIARGDLGIELEPARVPVLQKRIIAAANAQGRPCIVATEMLESMLTSPRPTRAEVSDVANAILDGTDAVMLSGETAVGSYPIGAVRQLVRICELTERDRPRLDDRQFFGTATKTRSVAVAAHAMAEHVRATLIVVHTLSGATAGVMAAMRPTMPVLALSPNPRTLARLCLHQGVQSMRISEARHTEDLVDIANDSALHSGLAVKGNTLIMVSGPPGLSGKTDRVLVHEISDIGSGHTAEMAAIGTVSMF